MVLTEHRNQFFHSKNAIIRSFPQQSRPKKANVFGNVDDESPERERAKKKRDLATQLRPEGAAGDSRKRGGEDPNAVAAKKPKAPQPEGGMMPMNVLGVEL